ncbi:MAG: signal transduction histidine kinase/ActR/RegA family two-component response regulator [Candidatus Azotimanducaceae bacterium]|jgi:signal transduction histidine kinase/ActR/RegA family two-component response regulator
MLQDTLNLLRRQFLGLNRVLSTVMELVNEGLTHDNEEELLQFAAKLLIHNHNFQFCTIHMINRNKLNLSVAISTESILDPGKGDEKTSPWVQTCEHLASDILKDETTVLTKKYAGETVYYCMPLVYRGETIGIVAVNSPGFDENHPKLVSIFCNTLTSVLINARQSQTMAEAVKKRTEELEAAWRVTEHSLKAKSQFLTNMSHEYRTPLNSILGASTLLQETDLSDEQTEYLGSIHTSSSELLRMLNEKLDFSRNNTGDMDIEPVEVNLVELLEGVAQVHRSLAENKELFFEVLLPTNMPEIVLCDPGRLTQVLNHLLWNAVKFTDGGRVTLDIGFRPEASSQITVSFTVLDTGIGMDKEMQKTAFEAFSQADESNSRRYQGSGLGLAVSQQLVNLMGGHIKVDSEMGEGSKFYFSLILPVSPKNEDNPIKFDSSVDSSKHELERMKAQLSVLLVEDNIINQKLAARLLEKMGCKVDIADDGVVAVKMFRRSPYDVVFMDCQMPNMDGFEATSKIREIESNNSHTPIIALTANSMPEDRARSFEVGMDEFLTKPILKDKLRNALEKWGTPH